MTYSLKQGVSIHVTPEIERMLNVASKVYRSFRLPLIVTSALDGPHREGSKHYSFRAFDIRKNFTDPEDQMTWGIHWQYILEGLRSAYAAEKIPAVVLHEQDHIHIEWGEP